MFNLFNTKKKKFEEEARNHFATEVYLEARRHFTHAVKLICATEKEYHWSETALENLKRAMELKVMWGLTEVWTDKALRNIQQEIVKGLLQQAGKKLDPSSNISPEINHNLFAKTILLIKDWNLQYPLAPDQDLRIKSRIIRNYFDKAKYPYKENRMNEVYLRWLFKAKILVKQWAVSPPWTKKELRELEDELAKL
ncbi:MAG: hypothetical protein PHG05_00590 [Candidatus Nanoarchaeia archaeon]|nr:hypothetical protein [Candidatus Nanoarchaeia archaeon]